MSLLPHLWNQIIEVNNLKNDDQLWYGQDEVWTSCIVRPKCTFESKSPSLTNLRGVAKAEINFAIEIKDQPKKALEGIAIFLYYF